MSPEVITTLIAAVMGGIGVKLVDLLVQWSRGRMDEAQRRATEVDRLRRYIRRLVEALHATRALALRADVPMKDLPEFPAEEDLRSRRNHSER